MTRPGSDASADGQPAGAGLPHNRPPGAQSGRTGLAERALGHQPPNSIARARADLSASGVQLTDLTDTNPTRHGLLDPAVLDAVARATLQAHFYDPSPRGPLPAREALAAHFGGHPDEYWLTSSTSQAYAYLLTILAQPGDGVGIPGPGYPLLEPLAQLTQVQLWRYPWHYLHPSGWECDTALLSQRAARPHLRTRALVAVNPGNPTGAYVDVATRECLVEACQRTGAALIADEVFHPFSLPAAPGPHPAGRPVRAAGTASAGVAPAAGTLSPSAGAKPAPTAAHGGRAPGQASSPAPQVGVPDAVTPARLAGEDAVLTCALDGLSKLLCAPQLKLGWIRVTGPRDGVGTLAGALDQVSDTFLPVGGPVALALPALLDLAGPSVARTRQRLAANLQAACEILGEAPLRVRTARGGWMVLVDVPKYLPEEDMVIALLRRAHLAVHPGWFYDMAGAGTLALSLLPRPAEFRAHCERLRAAIEALG